MGAKHRTRSASSKRQKGVAKLPEILRRYDSLLVDSLIDSEALDSFAVSELRERAHTFLDPDDEAYLEGERGVLYYLMLGNLPKRCHRVFRLRFVRNLKLPAIATLLGIELQTAERDLERALKVAGRKVKKMGREGVVAKRK